MSENSSQERTEEPTEKRLKKAKEDGQVARSKELNTAILLITGFAGLIWFAQLIMDFLITLMEHSFQLDHTLLDSTKMMPLAVADAFTTMVKTTLPYFLLLFIAMWISGGQPGGYIFSGKQVGFKASKLNPLSGLARMFSSNAWVELLKSMVKIGLLGLCLYGFLTQLWGELLQSQQMELIPALQHNFELLALCLMLTATLLLLIAAIDVPYQKEQINKKVRMTKQEVKEERKSTDGSPELKNRIRQIQYQMANRKIDERVPQADVVITNPTHYAIAIRYSEQDAKAPYVIAKGVDAMALRIRKIAQESDLEIVEIPPLARAIYYSTRVDQEVPAGLYTAVAYVLSYVTQLQAYRQGRGHKPAPIPSLAIPKQLLDRANARGQ